MITIKKFIKKFEITVELNDILMNFDIVSKQLEMTLIN